MPASASLHSASSRHRWRAVGDPRLTQLQAEAQRRASLDMRLSGGIGDLVIGGQKPLDNRNTTQTDSARANASNESARQAAVASAKDRGINAQPPVKANAKQPAKVDHLCSDLRCSRKAGRLADQFAQLMALIASNNDLAKRVARLEERLREQFAIEVHTHAAPVGKRTIRTKRNEAGELVGIIDE